MKKKVAFCLALLICFSVTGCGSNSAIPGSIVAKVYVIVPAEKNASQFTTYLASVVKRHGMTPSVGKATDDKGYSIYVLDATSPSVRLRSENVLLSGQEEPKLCGLYTEPHSDPGQYFVSVSQSSQMTDSRASREMLANIVKDLKVDGYNVQSQYVICSPRSKVERRG